MGRRSRGSHAGPTGRERRVLQATAPCASDPYRATYWLSLCRTGDAGTARSLWEEMVVRGVPRNLRTVRMLLRVCAERGDPELSERAIQEMEKSDPSLVADPTVLRSLILSRRASVESARVERSSLATIKVVDDHG